MRKALLVSLLLLAPACVRTDVQMLDGQTAMISARGTAFDNRADVIKGTLQKAAETAQKKGYSHFKVVGAQDTTTRTDYQTSSTAYTTGTVNSLGPNMATYSGTTTVDPGQSYEFIKPGADVTIRLLHADQVADDAKGVWKASEILAQAESEQ